MYNDFASFYDGLAYNSEYGRRAEYVYGLLSDAGAKDGILLDLGCGTGNFSVAMAEKGYDVIAVDASPDMLMQAQAKAAEKELDILFLCQDMTMLDLYGTVGSCICLFDTFNHLGSAEEFARAVSRVSLFMEPGGAFIFDVNTEYKHRTVLGSNTFVIDTGDVYCVWRNSTDSSLVTELKLDFFAKDGGGLYSRSGETFTERAFSHDLILRVLAENGFEDVTAYRELTREAPDEKTQRIFYTAIKRG